MSPFSALSSVTRNGGWGVIRARPRRSWCSLANAPRHRPFLLALLKLDLHLATVTGFE